MAVITGIRTHIFIGNLEIFRCPECSINYSRHSHLSCAEILLPDPGGNLFKTFKASDPVIIRMGYRDQVPNEWTGTISKLAPPNKKDQILVKAVGMERPLSDTRIIQSWENETPEAIVTWAIGQAGLEIGKIDSPGVTFPRFIASNIPVWQLVRQCEHTCLKAFGLDMNGWALWMDSIGKVNWCSSDEDVDIPVIETGSTLIRHLPATGLQTGLSLVETFLMPGFKRCMKFRLRDSIKGIDQILSGLEVRHVIKPTSVRTFIQYGEMYEKY